MTREKINMQLIHHGLIQNVGMGRKLKIRNCIDLEKIIAVKI